MNRWLLLCVGLGLLCSIHLPAQQGIVSQAIYHTETDEVSIDLRFRNDLEVSDDYAKQLINTADSIIKDEDYQVRKKLSSIAFDYFDTTGYAQLWYFTEQHQLIGQLHFERFEYQDDDLDAYFKAVFSIEKREPSTQLVFSLDQYVISSPLLPFFDQDFQSSAIHSEIQVSPSEEAVLGFGRKDILDGSVIDWNSLKTHYVVTLGNYGKSEWTSKIISNTNPTAPLFQEYSEFAFYSVNALPIIVNDYPVLFCHKGKPDTDWRWSEFMYFNGTHYVVAEDGSIPLPSN